MKNDDAKDLMARPVDAGTLTGDEFFVLRPSDLTTRHLLKLITRNDGLVVTLSDAYSKEVLLKDEVLSKSYVSKHPQTDDLIRLAKPVHGSGMNALFLYKKEPAFEGQQPSDHVEEEAEEHDTKLYVYGRMLAIPESGDHTAYSIFSVVIGHNPDIPHSGLGYQWKDIYKGVRIPQFRYSACVMDMKGNLLLKSKQESDYDMRPVFEVAPGVDLVHAIYCCMPLLPDGKKTLHAIKWAAWMVL